MASGSRSFYWPGPERVRRPGQWRAGQHGVSEGHNAEVTLQVFLLDSLRDLALRRPDPDYCTGIPAQSVFIRERAKIVREGSGPLIHLKRQMKGG